MKKTALLAAFAASAVLVSTTASATVLVLQKSIGRHCYEAARTGNASAFAIATCDNALASGLLSRGDEAATYVNRGIVRLHAKQYDAALTDFDQALLLDPRLAESYLNRGSVFLRSGQDLNQAIAMFDRALSMKMKHPELAYYNRGMAHEASGNISAAYLDYQTAQKMAPKWRQPKEELSRFSVTR